MEGGLCYIAPLISIFHSVHLTALRETHFFLHCFMDIASKPSQGRLVFPSTREQQEWGVFLLESQNKLFKEL